MQSREQPTRRTQVASVIVEGANDPSTSAADAGLQERGTLIVPEGLANADGLSWRISSGCKPPRRTCGAPLTSRRAGDTHVAGVAQHA
ncbi:hypothetical protein [Mycolicibacterium goodii]|uniref:hypothetical protein n=1 Tax=Mycolicibacterium goodii TaxID=134601 RepID=UPI003305BD46